MNITKTVPVDKTIFTFTDNDGEIFARLQIDPTDPRLLKRVAKISEFFRDLSTKAVSLTQYEETIEQEFCDLLGYDCKAELFGSVAAVSTMKDGNCFAIHVVETLVNHLGPEIKRRREDRIRKYTAKYTVAKEE